MIYKETVDAYMEVQRRLQEKKNSSTESNLGMTDFIFGIPLFLAVCAYDLMFGDKDEKDVFWHPNIPDEVKADLRRNFGLDLEEEILFAYDTSPKNSRNQGVVITDVRIVLFLDCDDKNSRLSLWWEDIESVKYKEFQLHFYFYDDSEPLPLPLSYFSNGIENVDERYKKDVGEFLSELFTRMAETQVAEEYIITEQIIKLLDEGATEDAIKLMIKLREEFGKFEFTPKIAEWYLKNGEGEKGLRLLDNDIQKLEADPERAKEEEIQDFYFQKYLIHKELGHVDEARRACVYVMNHTGEDEELLYTDGNMLDKATEDFKEIEKEFVSHFFEMPHKKRRLMVPVESYPDLNQKKLVLLDINNLPEIHFPMGHPIANQLYVGHPYTPSKYIPFEDCELEFLVDKLREYCQVMQFLGATEINIECLNSTDSGKDMHKNKRVSGGGSINASVKASGGKLAEYGGGISGSLNSEKDTTNKLLEAISQSIKLHQRYSPHSAPRLPENLVWYANDPLLQHIFEQRKQGSLLEHEERIETKKNRVVNNSELSDISAELSILVNAKTLAGGGSGGFEAKGRKEELKEVKLDESENAVLFIHVKFAPLESLQGNDSTADQPTTSKKWWQFLKR